MVSIGIGHRAWGNFGFRISDCGFEKAWGIEHKEEALPWEDTP